MATARANKLERHCYQERNDSDQGLCAFFVGRGLQGVVKTATQLSIAEMHVQGVSTRWLKKSVEELRAIDASSALAQKDAALGVSYPTQNTIFRKAAKCLEGSSGSSTSNILILLEYLVGPAGLEPATCRL
jgi:hypothetical protein